ncbi:hypothetical protein AB4Z21_23215 [Paenibacillus sp. MCAF20]
MKRKHLGKATISTMIAFSLVAAGCQSGSGTNKESAPEGSPETVVSKDGYPIVQQPIKLKMFSRIAPVNGPFKDMPVFQDYEKTSNVQVEFTEVPERPAS